MCRRDIYWCLAVVFISFLVAVESSKNETPKCPSGQEFQECGSSCNETCDVRLEDMVCDRRCVPRCGCINEAPVWHDGRCIPRRGCPGETKEKEKTSDSEKSHKMKCPRPQVYASCGSACNMTCDSYPDEGVCSRNCVERCECPSTLPIWYKGNCISFEQCPDDPVNVPLLPSDFNCPEGQIFQFCGSECNHTCEHGEEGPACPQICVKRCGCPESKPVWHKGRCVEYEKCKKKDEVDERGLVITTKPTSPSTETTTKPETERYLPRSLEKQVDETLRLLLEAIANLPSSK